MYTLRRIFKDGSYSNLRLGNHYTVIDCHVGKKFDETKNYVFGDSGEGEDVVCFVTNGDEIIPIYKNEQVFVMTESGKTFERLRF